MKKNILFACLCSMFCLLLGSYQSKAQKVGNDKVLEQNYYEHNYTCRTCGEGTNCLETCCHKCRGYKIEPYVPDGPPDRNKEDKFPGYPHETRQYHPRYHEIYN